MGRRDLWLNFRGVKLGPAVIFQVCAAISNRLTPVLTVQLWKDIMIIYRVLLPPAPSCSCRNLSIWCLGTCYRQRNAPPQCCVRYTPSVDGCTAWRRALQACVCSAACWDAAVWGRVGQSALGHRQ